MKRAAILVVVGMCAVVIPPLVVMGQTPLGAAPTTNPAFSSPYSSVSSIALMPPFDEPLRSSLDRAEQKLGEAFDLFDEIAREKGGQVLTRSQDSTL